MKFSLFEFAVGIALLTGQTDAFWRMECRGRTALARIDPLVNPGEVANHVHTSSGGSGFSPTSGFEELRASDCTACAVTQDKSAYWTIPLYFKHASTGEYTLVEQVGGMLAYYFLNYAPGETSVTAFPAGFSMVAGTTKRRATDDTLEGKAIGFNCLNYGEGVTPENTLARHQMPTKEFLDANCVDGIRAELMFPSCWDGEGLKGGDDNKDHVSYPDSVMDGSCPTGFKTRLPGLMYETIWNTAAFAGVDGEFVWSQGDSTGFGYHGDFINGWDPEFLQSAADTCTNMSGRIQDCPIFDIQTEATSKKCFIGEDPYAADFDGPMSNLPGISGVSGAGTSASAAASSSAPVAVSSQAATSKVAEIKVVAEASAVAVSASAVIDVAGGIFQEQSASSSEVATSSEITAAPVASLEDGQEIYTTRYTTLANNEVVEIVVIEETVTVTEEVVTQTAYKTVLAYEKRAHGHARRHAAHA